MLISPALAHGTTTGEQPASYGPLILLGVAVVFVLALVAEKKWRKRKLKRDDGNK